MNNDNPAVTIKELDDAIAALKRGEGQITIYDDMPDELIAKRIRKAIKRGEGMPFTVNPVIVPEGVYDPNYAAN